MAPFDVPLKDPAAVWPSLEELLHHTSIVSIPLNTRFRGVSYREAAIFTGGNRASEFSPFIEYDVAEAANWLAAALNYGYGPLPPAKRDSVPVNATVPAIEPAQLPELLARYGEKIHTVKIKVAEAGQELAEDITRVREVRKLLPQAALRIDANGGYTQQNALRVLSELEPIGLEYVEQPVAGIEPLAELRQSLRQRGITTKIAADEAVRKATDPLKVAELGAADLLVLKVQPLGGIHRALAIVEETRLPAVISSALDTGVGICMGVALAASLPQLDFACGLATGALYQQDVLTKECAAELYADPASLAPVEPRVDAIQLQQLEASTDRTEWWQERIRACYQHLHG